MKTIQLLSTDFDGTLIGVSEDCRCLPVLAEALEAVQNAGAVWAVNTGRSLDFALVGLQEFRPPVIPSFLIVNERHVFGRVGNSWLGLGNWNEICDQDHEELFARSKPLLREIRRWVAVTPGVRLLPDAQYPEGIVTDNEALMDKAVEFLRNAAKENPDFAWQRNTVYLRFCHTDYHKGSALVQLAKEVGVGASGILAIGDHHNDLSMLHPSVAGMLACPGNAVQEVREAVRNAGGFTSRHLFGKGTAEGIFFYLRGEENTQTRGEV